MTLLTVRGLTKSFRSRGGGLKAERLVAVSDVSFDIEAGETFAVVGESGAGKSTVARLVIRLIEPDEGSVHMDGTDVRALSRSELRRFRRRVQMVFQDPYSALDPRFEIGRAVAQPLRVHFGMSRADRERETARLLDSVGLDRGYAHRFPHQLSGGQLQRVCIARALAVKPKLIVCDEAVSALDVSIRAQILNLLTEIQEREHVAYLFITHDLAVVEALADRVAVMQAGRIVEAGTTAEVMSRPREAYTRDLLGAIPRFHRHESLPETSDDREAESALHDAVQ